MELSDINERLEEQLKTCFGIELDHLPKETHDLLEELIDFQVTTKLCDIDSNLIGEWYINKRKENLDLRLKCLPIKSDIDSVKNMLSSQEKLVRLYEKVLEEQKSVGENEPAIEHRVETIQNQIDAAKKRISKLPDKCQINLKELLEKIQTLNKDSSKYGIL